MFNCGDVIWAGKARKWIRAAAGRHRFSFLRDKRGATAIEFAITLPLLLLIVMGTLEFGRALKARNEMSQALSRAARVINLDSEQTTEDIAATMRTYLSDYGSGDLDVGVLSTAISGTDYMNISVGFPFHTVIPFSSVSTVTLNVDTLVPVISPTK
jgi:Flp pilus assembly pilin Flp